MAGILPFKSVRPRADLADRIAALPYDVYNRAEAKAEVEREPMSFLAIDRAETSFDDNVSTYDDRVYKAASEMLNKRIEEGSFIQDDTDCYYIYELTMDGRAQTGIVAVASVDDYDNAVIKKHENTRAEKEQDRIRHVDTCNAQTGPIFLAYRRNEVITDCVNKHKKGEAVYDFTSPDGIRHRVFKIDDADSINAIKEAFAGIN